MSPGHNLIPKFNPSLVDLHDKQNFILNSVQCYEPRAQIAQHYLSGKGRIDGIRSIQNISIWRRKWQPTPVFLPGESQGQGSLVGCHLWGRTESDMTEAT